MGSRVQGRGGVGIAGGGGNNHNGSPLTPSLVRADHKMPLHLPGSKGESWLYSLTKRLKELHPDLKERM